MSALNADTFLVREHVGMLKLHEAYDILTPDGELLGTAVEQANAFRKILKLFMNKNMLPFMIELRDTAGQSILTIQRPFTFLRSMVSVYDGQGRKVGYFKQRLFSLGGAFDVFDMQDQPVATLKGNLLSWNFTFSTPDEEELGQVSRKWGGLAQELFTSADNYVVHLVRERIKGADTILLLLAAALCIDMVFKESQ